MPRITLRHKVWGNKTAAVLWAVAGVLAFPFGWANTIWFVVICSIWANVFASWSTAEAADDRELKELLHKILENQNGNRSSALGNCSVPVLYCRSIAERSSCTLESGCVGVAPYSGGNAPI